MQHSFRFLLGLSLGAFSLTAQAQSVGIGTTSPDANAALDISAGTGNNKGLLIPRMTQAQRVAVTTTTEGMLVYQTNGDQPGFWYFSGGVWVALPSGVASSSGWLRTGNSGTDAGTYTGVGANTNAGSSFVGTTDQQDLVFRTGNTERLRVTTDGSIYSRSTFGLILNARDAPMLTRGWNTFSSGDYNGLGRWGMFMLSSRLALGIPANTGSFSWVTWNANSTIDKTLMTLQNGGNLGLGIDAPTTRLSVVGAGAANPFASGPTQSTGHIARFRDNGNVALDLGSSGTGGNWLQSTNPTDLSANYALRLNPNGGNVGIGTGNTAPNSTLTVGGTMSVAVATGIAGGASGNPTLLTNSTASYLALAPVNGTADYALPDPTTCPGRMYYIRNNSAGQAAYLTLTGYAAGSRQLFNGNSSTGFQFYTLPSNASGKTIICISDGLNWTIGQLN